MLVSSGSSRLVGGGGGKLLATTVVREDSDLLLVATYKTTKSLVFQTMSVPGLIYQAGTSSSSSSH
jgi:hypothetical protein